MKIWVTVAVHSTCAACFGSVILSLTTKERVWLTSFCKKSAYLSMVPKTNREMRRRNVYRVLDDGSSRGSRLAFGSQKSLLEAMSKITSLKAREILDSRGNPTVEVADMASS